MARHLLSNFAVDLAATFSAFCSFSASPLPKPPPSIESSVKKFLTSKRECQNLGQGSCRWDSIKIREKKIAKVSSKKKAAPNTMLFEKH